MYFERFHLKFKWLFNHPIWGLQFLGSIKKTGVMIMTITIQTEFNSAVVEVNKDVFSISYIENGNTIIEFDMRTRDYQKEFGITSEIFWKESYKIDVHEFSTFHNPIIYRFITAQGYYSDEHGNRRFFTPETAEVSTQQHMSKSIIRLSCVLAVICGVTLRNIATIFTYLFCIPVTKSTIKRWIDEIGENLPSEEEILKKLIELKKPAQCHIDGYYTGSPLVLCNAEECKN